MQFIRLIVMLGVAIAPLIFLTASTFFRGPTAAVGGWTAPALEEFAKVRSSVESERTRLADGNPTTSVDPAGFSLEDEPEGDLALPYELAERLAAAEKARHGDDLEAAEAARNGLNRMVADRLVAIQKIPPNGLELAAEVKRRLELTTRRCIWLTNRQLAGRELKAAEEAIATGPEGDGETKCLLTINGLRKQLPAMPESIAEEPGNALAPDEAAWAARLESRALFRRDFFKLRQSARAEAASSRDLERLLEEWAVFVATYGKNGPPDDRDKPILDEAKTLQRKTQLDLLRVVAREAGSVVELVERVAAWLKEAGGNPVEFAQAQKAASALVQKWLESNVSPLLPLPKPMPGVEEGFTKKRRLIGFFEKVPNTPAQYRFWPWDMPVGKRLALNKGDEQPNLTATPTPPQHEAYAADHAESRKEFLAGGFTTRQGVDRFRADCDRLAEEFGPYRKQWDNVSFPADKVADNWGEDFAAGRKIAEDLLANGEKYGLWNLLK